MKRSEILNIIKTKISEVTYSNVAERIADQLLTELERNGLKLVRESKETKPKGYRWGVMCSMHCSCEDCDPNFKVVGYDKE